MLAFDGGEVLRLLPTKVEDLCDLSPLRPHFRGIRDFELRGTIEAAILNYPGNRQTTEFEDKKTIDAFYQRWRAGTADERREMARELEIRHHEYWRRFHEQNPGIIF